MQRTVLRRLGLVALAALLASTFTLVGPASPAQATAAQCEGGANGFIDISDSLRGTQVYAVDLGNSVTVRLYYGTVSGAQRGWAMIDGATWSGDRVWMDWTTNWNSSGNFTWLQCGPFSVGSNGTTKTSAAKTTSSSSTYRFRACGRLVTGSTSKCGAWW